MKFKPRFCSAKLAYDLQIETVEIGVCMIGRGGDRKRINGKRLIILHAMTDRGLLAIPNEVASNWLSEPALTAELVFEEVLEDGQDDSDYHSTITGAKFVVWLRNRLLPTFNELYPGKKMYLVLDNAAYHKPRDETWISAAKSQSKHELAHQLQDLGVTQLDTVGNPPPALFQHTNLNHPFQRVVQPKKISLQQYKTGSTNIQNVTKQLSSS